jgi:hypothetical protein
VGNDQCKHCGRAGRYEVTVPDNKVRLDAVQALLHEALGRPRQAEPQQGASFPGSAHEVRLTSWDQMTLVFATQFAAEIAAVSGDGNAGCCESGSRGARTRVSSSQARCRTSCVARGATDPQLNHYTSTSSATSRSRARPLRVALGSAKRRR